MPSTLFVRLHTPLASTYTSNQNIIGMTEASLQSIMPYTVEEELSDNAEHSIRQAAHSSGLHIYFKSKYHWSYQSISTIDYAIHSQAVQSLPPNPRKMITQMIHEWLPVNAHPGRSNHRDAKSCPMCKREQLSQSHFLTCDQHISPWEQNFHNIIHSQSDNNNKFQKILLWALLQCWVLNKSFPTGSPNFPTQLNHPSLTQLIIKQSKIDWNQILNGRWTTQWVLHLDLLHPNKGKHIAITCLTGNLLQELKQ
jgi:hypothetical protein